MPSQEVLARLMGLCERHYCYLVDKAGCDEDVAADRTYDCLRAALGEVEHCCDQRDQLFEMELREAAERG